MYALRQACLSSPTAHTHRPCNLQPQYLSGYSVKECSSICDGVTEPFCAHCPAQGASPNCKECHECLSQHHIGRYNIMDGTCLRLVEYGILYGPHAPQFLVLHLLLTTTPPNSTGFGFTLVYVFVNIGAGRLADAYNRRYCATPPANTHPNRHAPPSPGTWSRQGCWCGAWRQHHRPSPAASGHCSSLASCWGLVRHSLCPPCTP